MRRTVLLLASTALAVLLTSGVVLIVPTQTAQAAFLGKNGKIAFSSNRAGDYEIYKMNADGTEQTNLTNTPNSDTTPAWSPDGTEIAFQSWRNGQGDIYVMDADGSNQTRLTDNPGQDASPTWSPDGTKLAFVSNRDGHGEIYVMNRDGSNQTNVSNRLGEDADPAWSPDGTELAFSSSRDKQYVLNSYEIYVMNADGSSQTRMTYNQAENRYPAWSPDGTKLAFSSGDVQTREYDIYVMDADGSNPTNITNNPGWDSEPAWSPDGTKLAFRSGVVQYDTYVMDADGSNPTNITNNSAADTDPDWGAVPPSDTAPPETTINSGPQGPTNDNTPSFTFGAQDDITPKANLLFSYKVDGGAWSPYSASTSTTLGGDTGLSNGAYTLYVRAKDEAGNVDTTPAQRNWTLDANAPIAAPPAQNLIAGSALGTTTVPVVLEWSATDVGMGVSGYSLQQSIDGGGYDFLSLPSPTTTTLTLPLDRGKSYGYRVQARDEAGNLSGWTSGPLFVVDQRQENYRAITYTGTWKSQAASTASGGYTRHASASGARAKFSFAGRNVAWVAPTGPNRGKAEVWIDGAKAATVDLYSPTAEARKMVFTRGWPTPGNHTLQVRVLGTKNAESTGKRVDVDAFVALR